MRAGSIIHCPARRRTIPRPRCASARGPRTAETLAGGDTVLEHNAGHADRVEPLRDLGPLLVVRQDVRSPRRDRSLTAAPVFFSRGGKNTSRVGWVTLPRRILRRPVSSAVPAPAPSPPSRPARPLARGESARRRRSRLGPKGSVATSGSRTGPDGVGAGASFPHLIGAWVEQASRRWPDRFKIKDIPPCRKGFGPGGSYLSSHLGLPGIPSLGHNPPPRQGRRARATTEACACLRSISKGMPTDHAPHFRPGMLLLAAHNRASARTRGTRTPRLNPRMTSRSPLWRSGALRIANVGWVAVGAGAPMPVGGWMRSPMLTSARL